MLYSISSSNYPLEYASSGILDSPNQFLHQRRCIDTFVLIIVQTGTLYITMADREYEIGPNQFIFLFPYIVHFGTRPSNGRLTYFWMHFKILDPDARLYDSHALETQGTNFNDLIQRYRKDRKDKSSQTPDHVEECKEYYLLPAAGSLNRSKMAPLICQFVLDMTKRDHYKITWRCHYLASYLVLETSYEATLMRDEENKRIDPKVLSIMEYIRTHYPEPISAKSIAASFGYHPTYIERIFKSNTGYALTYYINKVRIEASQNLLLNSIRKVGSIATMCGFSDVKYFIKKKKKYIGMSPSQYRKSISQKKINLQ